MKLALFALVVQAITFNFKGDLLQSVNYSLLNDTLPFIVWTQQFMYSRNLILEGGVKLKIDFLVSDPLVLKYLTFYNRQQAQDAASVSPFATTPYLLPSLKRFEVYDHLQESFGVQLDNVTYIYAILWVPQLVNGSAVPDNFTFPVPAKDADIVFNGTLYALNGNDKGELTSDDYAASLPYPYLLTMWGGVFFAWTIAMAILKVAHKPYVAPFLVAMLTQTLSQVFGLIYYHIIAGDGMKDSHQIWISVAYVFTITSDALIFFAAGCMSIGWSVFINGIPMRELLIYLFVLGAFVAMAIGRDTTGSADGASFMQLGVEFLRVILAFIINIILTASSLRWRSVFVAHARQASNNVGGQHGANTLTQHLQNRQTLLATLNSSYRLNHMAWMARVIPPLLIMPTALIFLQAYSLKDLSSYFAFTMYNFFCLIWYSVVCYSFIPQAVDIAPRVNEKINGSTFQLEKVNHVADMHVPKLFLDEVVVFGRENGTSFWVGLGIAVENWAQGWRANRN